jgi:D-alanyl-D-alanine carboxypeptidase
MEALLIYSANDVANALAVWDSGSQESFVLKMNQKAKQWGLEDTYFNNPSGLDTPGQKSSAQDLLTLTRILEHNKNFQKITATRTGTISNLAGKPYALTTTNKLLGTNGVIGVKTGFTLEAGQCLITLSERGGHRIITVVLNSPDRFQESKNMIDWAFNNHIWQ